MSRNLKIKIGVLVALAAVSLAVMVALLSTMQTNLALQSSEDEMRDEMAALPGQLDAASAEAQQDTETYDAIYQSRAESVAFMANNDAGFAATDAKMAEYKNLLDVDNVMVVSRDGAIIARAQDTRADFAHGRFNQLRTTLNTGEPSDAVEVELPDEGWLMRYYAAAIDENTMVVVEQSPEELRQLVESTGSTAAVLKNVTFGQHGYMFAISAQDYTVAYHPDDALVGVDSLDEGLDVAELEDGNVGWMEFAGERLYCQVSEIGDMYYIAAVPESDIAASRNLTVGVISFIFLAVMVVVIMYAVFTLRDDERRARIAATAAVARGGSDAPAARAGFGFNAALAKKAAVMSFVGFLAILGVSFYMQTLFALSSQSLTNGERAAEVRETLDSSTARAADLEAQYNERYLSKAQVAGYILDRNPELANRADLQRLADVLQVQYLFTYNGSGEMTATNSSYANFTLSDTPGDQSYEFRKLLQGADNVVQSAQPDEISGELRQYIGVPLHGADGEVDGLVQLGIRPSRLETLLESLQIGNVLDGVKVGSDGFAFAVSKADGTIAYYPDKRVQGKDAIAAGMTQHQLEDGYNDYLTIDGKTLYASSVETDDYYVYVAGSEGSLMASRGPITLATGAMAFVCQLLIFLVVSFGRRGSVAPLATTVAPSAVDADGDGRPDRMIDVKLADGRTITTESAASRWLGKALGWDEMTPEQKTATAVRWLAAVSVACVFVAVIFRDRIFGSGSIFSYILGGGWEYGLNVFAVTAALMFICVAMTVVYVVQKLLGLMTDVLGARGATVCRLLSSFIKYATIIGMVYYSLMLIGVDTTALLASAGILSIAISFGAKELVSDILSGLFIIFEGEFRVGDVIQVGSSSGTVMEIGVRTTKIDDGSGNVLVLRNSNISNVLNKTKLDSYASCDMAIEYDESLERVENILEKELPKIKLRLPAIIDGPFYKGVVALADNSVNIRVVARCSEADRAQLMRDLNREMKLLFDRYDIPIPYAQVVVHQPREYQEATEAERAQADRFNAEQQAAAKGLGNEGVSSRDRD